jgi:hypothetical protein
MGYNRVCDVLCDVTAGTDSQICRCRPRCADVPSCAVNIEGDQYLYATAAICCIDLLTTAIQRQSIRDQEVPSSNLGAPTTYPKALSTISGHLERCKFVQVKPRHSVSTSLVAALRDAIPRTSS